VSFPRATIDCAALRNNLSVVRRFAPDSRVIAAIKANAYGHGLVPAARALDDADAFGVARLDEALALRHAGIFKPIVLLEGVFSPEQLAVCAQQRLEVVVHSLDQVAQLEARPASDRHTVWLKLNTGMNRLGLDAAAFAQARDRARQCASVATVRVMTHLAAAEERGGEETRRQLDRFREATDALPFERSVGNSAGLIAWPEARTQWVRPGLMLYGISPFADTSAASLGLRPAMTFSTELISLHTIEAGEAVGYNGIWRAQRRSKIAIAAVGYGDGYPRGVSAKTTVLVEGREATVVGRVSMDMIAIDVTDLPSVRIGSPVILWGQGLPVERIAACAGTIGYELVCRINERVARDWKN
jgi:alanine racemase